MYNMSLSNLLGVTNWEVCFIFRATQTTSCDICIGFTTDNAAIGIGKFYGTSFGVRYSSAVDTNFMFFSKNTNLTWAANDANNYSLSTGVAADNGWHKIRMRSTSVGVVEMSLDAGAWTAVTMVYTGNTNFIPSFYVSTRTTATKSLDADFYSFRQAGSR